jgi:hypothetical protein
VEELMGVTFSEGRGLPREFSRGGGYEGFGRHNRYGDSTFTEAGGVAMMKAISPWDLLTGIFVTKPAQERAAQVAIAEAQVQAQGQAQYAKSQNLKTLLMYGGGAIGALVLVVLLTKRRAPAVGGHRSRRSRRSRR